MKVIEPKYQGVKVTLMKVLQISSQIKEKPILIPLNQPPRSYCLLRTTLKFLKLSKIFNFFYFCLWSFSSNNSDLNESTSLGILHHFSCTCYSRLLPLIILISMNQLPQEFSTTFHVRV